MSEQYKKTQLLRQYTTAPHPCSYLPGEEASTLFVDPEAEINQKTYSYLTQRGYRRSGNYLYKPDCLQCSACLSLRIPVNDYTFGRSDKRILQRNRDLSSIQVEHIFQDAFYQLYKDYITSRHQDGDMYPPSLEQYRGFLNNPFGNTEYHAFIDEQQAIKAVAVIDRLDDGLSAIYTFFDAQEDKRSLGTYAILWQIQQAQKLGLDYVYLGYWVKQCPKMNYKTRFRPAEILINQRWLTVL